LSFSTVKQSRLKDFIEKTSGENSVKEPGKQPGEKLKSAENRFPVSGFHFRWKVLNLPSWFKWKVEG